MLNRSIRLSGFIPALACTLALALGWTMTSVAAGQRHAIAMHGEPALTPDFKAFPYVNPDAPKSGALVQGALGTFDSLNPLIVKGVAAISLRRYVLESLMARGY